MNKNAVPVYREDDGELLGCVSQTTSGWLANTVFGYPFARTDSQEAAEQIVRSQGLNVVKGMWQYLDPDDHAWHPCILTEIHANRVVLIRTNEMGYQDPDTYKRVMIKNPDETKLIKS